MTNIVPNLEGALAVDIINNVWNIGFLANAKAIFQYNGTHDNPQVIKIISEMRQNFPKIKESMAIIETIINDLP